jgi:hypothetical protein
MLALRIVIALSLAILLAATTACDGGESIPAAELKILRNAESFELFSLDPDQRNQPKEGSFQSWKILGSTKLDAATRAKVLAALEKGVSESDGTVAGCFNPRHGIRATSGGQTVELVICFECMSASTYLNGTLGKGFLLTPSPRQTFDAALKQANVPLPKAAE